MNTEQKRSETTPCETASSFLPLSEQSPNIKKNLPLPISQIQNLISSLVKRKAQLRQEKLKQECFNEKTTEQESRIRDLKIEMQHQINKQTQEVQEKEKLTEAIDEISIQIRQLNRKKTLNKNDANEKVEKILKQKKANDQTSDNIKQLQMTIKEKKAENVETDEKIQKLEQTMMSKQNEIRSKQDQITNLQLEENELVSLQKFIKHKIILMRKQNHEEGLVEKEKREQFIRLERKTNNLKKQKSDIDWTCQEVTFQNDKIRELNNRLGDDLQNVYKHLDSMKKTNKALKESLQDYSIISQKIAKLIIH